MDYNLNDKEKAEAELAKMTEEERKRHLDKVEKDAFELRAQHENELKIQEEIEDARFSGFDELTGKSYKSQNFDYVVDPNTGEGKYVKKQAETFVEEGMRVLRDHAKLLEDKYAHVDVIHQSPGMSPGNFLGNTGNIGEDRLY